MDQLLHALCARFEANHTKLTVTASIGISVTPGTGTHPDDLLRSADTAMSTAKNNGRAQHAR